jgi:hypothetical protein
MHKKEPDLSFERGNNRWSEGIEFHFDKDGYLEIKTVNSDSDTFIIILNTLEVSQLKNLLKDGWD